MKNLLYKEFALATSPIAFVFLIFTLMTFIPGYPILCGAFFICMGMFQSYQEGRADCDILYSVLLPVRKTDVVKGKYLSAVILQMAAFAIFAICTFIRMTVLGDKTVYMTNVLMSANGVFLAFVLVIFTLFNIIFIGGFFRTSYAYGPPFVKFTVVNFIIIGIAETLHHLPHLAWLNATGQSYATEHFMILSAAFILYIILTTASCKVSEKRFENTDL